MKRSFYSLAAIAMVFLLIISGSCKTTQKVRSEERMQTLLGMMQGSFSSAAQEAQDSAYYNISLHMYPVWESRAGHWLYVEQALFDMQDKPYRQRIYKVEQTGEKNFKTTVYSFTKQDEAIGKWKEPKWFDQFDESILELRDGCGVFLEETSPGVFEGSTKEGACSSSLRGASYASSIVRISKGEIYSWDQGFDAEGKQVWGATKGGYIFKKLD